MDTRPPFQPDFTAPAAPAYAPVDPVGTDAAALQELIAATSLQLSADQQAKDRMFLHSVLLGFAAMIAGALFHAAESSYSGLHFIYLAFVPGLLVGRAMKWKESVPGGLRYQVVAVILTYVSYLLAATLEILWSLHRTGIGVGNISSSGWGRLLVRSAELPFLEITDGLMGWVEIVAMGVGIYFAWKSTRPGAAVMRSRWERRPHQGAPPSILGR